jgi:hypothetical protein
MPDNKMTMTSQSPDAPLADIADYVASHAVQDESSITDAGIKAE